MEQFRDHYQLPDPEARRIVQSVGLGRGNLDAFMRVYHNRNGAGGWIMNLFGSGPSMPTGKNQPLKKGEADQGLPAIVSGCSCDSAVPP